MGFSFSPDRIKFIHELEQRTLDFAVKIVKFARSTEYNLSNKIILSQVIRSGCSVGANYREANEASSRKDFINRIRIVRREAKETIYWLEILEASNKKSTELTYLKKEATELFKIFCKMLSNLNNN